MNNVPFPLIIPIDEANKIYKGYVPIHSKEYLIQVQLGPKGGLSGSTQLEQLVEQRKKAVETKLHQATDIMSFLTELKEILESVPLEKTVKTFNYSSGRYTSIYAELTRIGFDRIHSMSDTMNEIVFVTRDKGEREHLLKVSLSNEYPFVPAQISSDLPKEMTPKPYLYQVLEEHESIINKYQPLFDSLDDLDKHMRIIEPEHPKRNDLWRRIALGHHCSFHIQLDPDYQNTKPGLIRFFGSSNRVQDLKAKWKSYAWNKQESLSVNLLNSFQIESSNTNNDYTNTSDIECGICYSYKLDSGDLPQIICSHPLCNRGFHSLCLYEWLRSNPTTTQSFNVLFGKCPYCNEKITIKAII